jgi:MarR family transcriptional repressor of emrRAB
MVEDEPGHRDGMTPTDGRTVNVFAALTLLASDAQRGATEVAAGRSDAAPAALASLIDAPSGRSVDQLRQMVGLTPSGGVRLVDRLVADGLVERRPGNDGRVVLVRLTRRGRGAAQRVLAARAAAVEQLLEPLDADERETLRALAAKMIEGGVVSRLEARRRGDVPTGGWLCRLCDQAACGRGAGECPAANAAAVDVARHR